MDTKTARTRAAALVAQMSVEEAASQLRYNAPAIDRLGIPAYNWWNEALHGVARAGTATVFPQAIGLAAAFDEAGHRAIAETIATEGRAKYNMQSAHGDRDIYKGLTFWSPNVNIFRDPRWGRGHETYGEDPYLTSRLGVAFVKALQKRDEEGYMRAAACAKHYAVHSGPEALRHSMNAEASPRDLRETYLPAFEACVREAEVEAVMGAYNRTNGEPCCGSTVLIRDILRSEWGFKGHFVSDCWAIKDFHENHKVTSGPVESVAKALKAGCDVNCGSSYEFLMEAYEKGAITDEELTEAAVRLFTTRILLGMFDKTSFDAIPYEKVDCPEHARLALKAAAESAVLLKNNGVLPFDRSGLKTIGVIGPNADNRTALMGNYHGTASRYITVLEGIQDAAGDGVRVLYSEGSHIFYDRSEMLAKHSDRTSEAVITAEHSDAVVLCLGLDETLEGEEGSVNSKACGDKETLELPASQVELMKAVLAVGKPTVVILMAGSSMDLRYADEHADAVMQVWYPGARGGKAVADILFGDAVPGGRLPITIYKDTADLPPFEDYSMKGRTYRYLESEPLYPFGFGLGYGKLTLTDAVREGNRVRIAYRNDSAYDCSEVLQVYAEHPSSPFDTLHPSLCGFRRVYVRPGETGSAEVELGAWDTVVDDEGKRVKAEAVLWAGLCQNDGRSVALSGSAPLRVK
ncbi:MAG: glycoside hydrolase family 3 C-terminal domain-containing protein [Oscillospiraceae bacterium]|nr:glycoside hydrolase family 3 C-terminal domain-containing protein [Oscillospiraceae bacterium]